MTMDGRPQTTSMPSSRAPIAPPVEQRLATIEAQLGQINAHLSTLVAAQRPMVDLRHELEPIVREVMDVSIQQLADLELKGYFDFGRQLLYLVDRIVEDYSPEDLRELADHAANILDTLRLLSQPSVLEVVRDIAKAFDEERDPKPHGLFAAWRKIRKSKHVQRGIGFTLDLVGRIGRAVSRAPRFSRDGDAPAPRLLMPPRRRSAAAAHAGENGGEHERSAPAQLAFVPDDAWSRDYALQVAGELGLGELGELHWKLVEFARSDYKKTGVAPNIRRVTGQTGVDTSQVYELLPRAPGLTISRLAGIPKPAGCI